LGGGHPPDDAGGSARQARGARALRCDLGLAGPDCPSATKAGRGLAKAPTRVIGLRGPWTRPVWRPGRIFFFRGVRLFCLSNRPGRRGRNGELFFPGGGGGGVPDGFFRNQDAAQRITTGNSGERACRCWSMTFPGRVGRDGHSPKMAATRDGRRDPRGGGTCSRGKPSVRDTTPPANHRPVGLGSGGSASIFLDLRADVFEGGPRPQGMCPQAGHRVGPPKRRDGQRLPSGPLRPRISSKREQGGPRGVS